MYAKAWNIGQNFTKNSITGHTSMVRKTKEQALATRCNILNAAEHLFQAQGVSGTSLHDIASAAGVTRGAVYWHFKDKADVFNAMMGRVCLPMEQAGAQLGRDANTPTLPALRAQLLDVLARVVRDEQVRRVLDIATSKIEYTAELGAVRARHLQIRNDYQGHLERTLKLAQKRGEVKATPSARQMAVGIHALMDGLIQNWMLEPDAFRLGTTGPTVLDIYLAGLAV